MVIRTEVSGLDLALEESSLAVLRSGEAVIRPVPLAPEDLERLAMEMAKAQLWEWNQLEELRRRADLRYRRYLASWLVMCAAAFVAYVSYPDYILCVVLVLFSIFLWGRAAYAERRADRDARQQRKAFRPDWEYLRQRFEEADIAPRVFEA